MIIVIMLFVIMIHGFSKPFTKFKEVTMKEKKITITLMLVLFFSTVSMNCGNRSTRSDSGKPDALDIPISEEEFELIEAGEIEIPDDKDSKDIDDVAGCKDQSCMGKCGELSACKECVCNKTTNTCEETEMKDCCPSEIKYLDFDEKEGVLTQDKPMIFDFEDGTLGLLKVEDANPYDLVTVSVISPPKDTAGNLQGIPKDSKYALYFGDPLCRTYYNADLDANCEPMPGQTASTVELQVSTPEFVLPSSPMHPAILMSLYVWIDVEDYIEDLPNSYQPDQFLVRVNKDSDFTTLMASTEFKLKTKQNPKDPNSRTEFWYYLFDLSEYYGKKISVNLYFNTGDGDNNYHTGIYVDNMKIWIDCDKSKSNSCTAGSSCKSDSESCTSDQCTTFVSTLIGYCGDYPWIFCCLYPECNTEGTQAEIEAVCDDGDICTKETCQQIDKCFQCVHEKIEGCCKTEDLFIEDFDEGSMGELIQESNLSTIKWQVSKNKSSSGEYSLYYGDLATKTYGLACGPTNANKGTVTFPELTIPEEGYTSFTFKLYINSEWDDSLNTYFNPGFDLFEVKALYYDKDIKKIDTIWTSHWIKGTTNQEFIPVGIDLSKYQGKSVTLSFLFDTMDCANNNYEGVYIDDIKIVNDSCKEIKCLGPYDCGAEGICQEATCDDNQCNVSDIGGEGCCVANFQCDDQDECTTETCIVNKCDYQFINTTECCNKTVVNYNFESGIPPYFTVNDTSSSVKWQTHTPPEGCIDWGTKSLYFGNKINYADENKPVSGWVNTELTKMPSISTGNPNPIYLSLSLYLDIDTAADKDIFKVTLHSTSPEQELLIFDKDSTDFKIKECTQIITDISNFKDLNVYLRFEFDSVDEKNNSGKGIWVDNIRYFKTCPE